MKINRLSLTGAALTLTLCVFLFAPPLQADTVRLKNGNTVEGIVEKETPESVDINLGFGSATFMRNEIAAVEKTNQPANQAIWDGWNKRRNEEAKRRPAEEKRRKEREAEEEWLTKEAERKRIERDEYGPKEVTVETRGGHFFIDLLLNGRVRTKLMLDSGASYITLSRRLADKLDADVDKMKTLSMRLADGREAKGALTKLESVEVISREPGKPDDFRPTGIKIEHVDVVFLTRANDYVSETPEKTVVPDDGLLGMSFLKHFELKLDYQGRKIVFQKNREL